MGTDFVKFETQYDKAIGSVNEQLSYMTSIELEALAQYLKYCLNDNHGVYMFDYQRIK